MIRLELDLSLMYIVELKNSFLSDLSMLQLLYKRFCLYVYLLFPKKISIHLHESEHSFLTSYRRQHLIKSLLLYYICTYNVYAVNVFLSLLPIKHSFRKGYYACITSKILLFQQIYVCYIIAIHYRHFLIVINNIKCIIIQVILRITYY